MANILNLPDLRPSLLLDFANSRQVDPRVTFTRASAATRWNAAGALETVPAGVPRVDYHPITGKCLGMFVEGAKTNMAPRNTTTGAVLGVLGSGGSLPTGWTVTPKATSGLDVEVVGIGVESGLPYVDLRVFGTATAGYQAVVFGNVTGYTTNREYSGTIFAKMLSGVAGGSGSLQLQARYNNSGGSVNISGGYTPASLNGDLRAQRLLANGSTDASATGAGQFLMVFNLPTSTVYDFRFRLAVPQLESGAASSVIFTDGAAATRADEFAGLLGANFSNWYRQDEGTFVFEGAPSSIAPGYGPGLFAVGDATLSFETRNGLYLNASSGTGVLAASLAVAGASQIGTNTVTGTFAAGVSKKTAFAYQTDNTVGATDGVLGVVDTLCTIPKGVTGLSLGELSAGWAGGTSRLNGHIRRFAFYPKRLTAAELKRITEA